MSTTLGVTLALAVLAAVAWGGWALRAGLVAARMYQIEEYEALRFLAWARRAAWSAHRAVVAALTGVVAAAFVAVAVVSGGNQRLALAAGWLVAALVANLLWQWLPPKKALVMTARMRRLLSVAAGAGVILLTAVILLVTLGPWPLAIAAVIVITATATLLVAAVQVVANFVLKPLQARIVSGFRARARQRVVEWDPLVIAVAGSYGKTSTKHAIAALLRPSIDTLPTPQSFNTLMGVTRAINETLQPHHRAFIVEMDAYAPGEIAAICRLTPPRIAVLTSVGPQHLERFGSVERIAAALYEEIAALPEDGTAVVYGGEPASAALAARAIAEGRRTVRYGMEGEEGVCEVWATDVRVDGGGSHFTWRWDAEGLAVPVDIPLLGRHNVLNVTAAFIVVHLLGHSVGTAGREAAGLEPVPHRLQLMPTANAIRVIDDSFNANPVGMHNGLEVLAAMPGGRRILVTPGMVELGSVEESENRRYGEHAASVCDEVIIMDSRPARSVLMGVRGAGMVAERVHVVRSLDEATAVIGRVATAGDTVLFANDLPDTYL